MVSFAIAYSVDEVRDKPVVLLYVHLSLLAIAADLPFTRQWSIGGANLSFLLHGKWIHANDKECIGSVD
jgi:hypothetical protein